MSIPTTINRNNNSFDFIRIFAAMLVFLGHSILIYQTKGVFNTNLGLMLGVMGVNIFFIVSGFLITMSYLETNNRYLFLKKRMIRIYPALLFAILFTVFILGPMTTFFTIHNYFLNENPYLYLNNLTIYNLINLNTNTLPGVFVTNKLPLVVNASLWTIPVEFFCYFLIILFGQSKNFKKISLFFFVFLLASSLIFTFNTNLQKYIQALSQMPLLDIIRLLTYFFSGVVIYLYRDSLSISKNYLKILLLAFFFLGMFGYFDAASYLFLPIILIHLAFNKIDLFQKITQLGDFSYGFYLFAFPIQQSVEHFFAAKLSFLQFNFISFFAVLTLAFLSYFLVEKPCSKFKFTT